jgi:UDP-3-O-[3-hydroxymyristoyl] glucosamine N-acyltransferase
MKLSELAEALGLPIHRGDPDKEIDGVGPIEGATETQVSYVAERKYAHLAESTAAGAVICSAEVAVACSGPCLVSAQPGADFARATRLFYHRPRIAEGVDPTARVAPTARLGGGVRIGPYVVVSDGASIGDGVEIHAHSVIYANVSIGNGTVIHAGCVVRENCQIGANCLLQPHAVVGSDGFGYARTTAGTYEHIEQMGVVVVEDDVEVGAGTTIDRATFGETRIMRGTKIDNLVQIGHNSEVGTDTILCAQVGLAGTSRIGRGVTLAGQVGVAGHLEIGDGVIATAQTGIPSSVEAGKVISGYPAIDNRNWLKSSAVFNRLPEMHKTLRRLEREVERLAARIEGQGSDG